ncbi:MAG: type II toxin-antitoxin system RelE/ParE family toxin [Sphingobacteriales bacterium]|nr:type II toxin-antitoxin system RelE/ParE family toxin [Sphingobacteriales bacterium]
MKYKIIIDNSAEKDFIKFPARDIKKISAVIDSLSETPKPIGIKKLQASSENLYRVRAGDYRIIYAIAEEIKIVNIRRIRHRKDVYRGL